MGEIVYNRVYDDAIFGGLHDEEGIMKLLLKEKIWDKNKEKEMEDLKKGLDDLKVALFQSQLNKNCIV